MCNNKNGTQTIPVFNQSTGELESTIFHIVEDFGLTNLKSNGIDLAESIVAEDGINYFDITLKVVTDEALPKFSASTPLNFTFKMAQTDMASFGINATTKIRFKVKLDTIEVPTPSGVIQCWIDYYCGCVRCFFYGRRSKFNADDDMGGM